MKLFKQRAWDGKYFWHLDTETGIFQRFIGDKVNKYDHELELSEIILNAWNIDISTGEKDNNGVELYTRDKVITEYKANDSKGKGVIEFHDGCFGVTFFGGNKPFDPRMKQTIRNFDYVKIFSSEFLDTHIEKIGTIYG